ncbi:hypothetical protein POM88_024072 [Heracleum sosnowskyi]|uniref:Transposase n=1 Tax=Heracleum sosnowskyi TaxID=360622 RepID=A0AAD8IL15_9APIA|nr:hypothetical protein POM88_024072 [Heracleum sosnowskyi]
MASSSFMNKQTVISGVTFATNNFVAVLDHQDLPTEFHIIQDFLASSPLKYALIELASVSFKSVMQVWNTIVFYKGHSGSILMSFEYDGVTHYVTPVVVEEALHLPTLDDQTLAVISDSTLFKFVTKLGYNGSLKIGYSLIYSIIFDYGLFVLKSLSDRKADKCGYVCFLRFFQLIFNHLCPDAIFEEEVVLPICRITDNNVKSLVNSDKVNDFLGNAYIPDEVRLFLQEKMPTQYGSVSDAMGQGQTHLVPDTSIQPKHSKTTSNVSQKTLVVKTKKLARSDVSGRQSRSKDFSSTPLTKQKKKGVYNGSWSRRLISLKRYHIPLKMQNNDAQAISNPDESSIPDAQEIPDVGIPDAPSQTVSISDFPASPSKRIIEISWEKVAETASKLGFTPTLQKKRKAEEIVFKRQKKLKGSSPQEPEPQSV